LREGEVVGVIDRTIGKSDGGFLYVPYFPLEYRTMMLGVWRERTNGKIIFEVFQPMWSRYLNVTDRRTDRRLCRSNTALWLLFHRI